MTMGKACKAICSPTPGLKKTTFIALNSQQRGRYFLHPRYHTAGSSRKPSKKKKREKKAERVREVKTKQNERESKQTRPREKNAKVGGGAAKISQLRKQILDIRRVTCHDFRSHSSGMIMALCMSHATLNFSRQSSTSARRRRPDPKSPSYTPSNVAT